MAEEFIWGDLGTKPGRREIIQKEEAAAQILGLNSRHIRIKQFLSDLDKPPTTGLSLACREGRAERDFLASGICDSFDAFDISEKAIGVAKQQAKAENLPISYRQADLNFIRLPKAGYDLVLLQNCLHHVLELEHLIDQVCQSLNPGGIVWVNDFIGESRFQFSYARLQFANAILRTIPESLRFNHLAQNTLWAQEKRDPDRIASPFEAIRSGEIKGILLDRFSVIRQHEYNAFLHLAVPIGTRQNYASTPEGQQIFKSLLNIDYEVIAANMLSPSGGQYILQRS